MDKRILLLPAGENALSAATTMVQVKHPPRQESSRSVDFGILILASGMPSGTMYSHRAHADGFDGTLAFSASKL